MKKIYSLILCAVMAFMVCGVMTVNVSADEATLSEMKVEAQNSEGDRTEVKLTPEFSADVTEYEATVMNDTIKLVITAATTEEDADYETDWEALDVGDNKTYVYVTAADGTKTTYTIYAKRLTEEEEATYEPEEDDSTEDDENGEDTEDTAIMVNDTEMKISSDFNESDVPEGFAEAEYEYEGKTYTVIKGDKKNLIAMWLKPVAPDTSEEGGENGEATSDKTAEEGFYIYDEEAGTFYDMDNIYIKSRMYTVVENATPDAYLNDYETTELDVIDEKVQVWVLDEANSLYLVYAMNWEGETALYCYDDIEKCFQRYIIDSAAANQIDAANEKINNLQNKNNELVKKYNDSNSTKWKIIAVLAILVVILFFVSINLYFSLKTKLLGGDDEDNNDNDKSSRAERKQAKARVAKSEPKREQRRSYYDDEDDEEEEELFKLVEDDDFIIVNDNRSANSEKNSNKSDFDLGEIDISAQVMKEMETPAKEEKVSFKAPKEEPFNEESLQDILSTAFPKEEQEDDDDGFTFI